jgi:hypothetical protein
MFTFVLVLTGFVVWGFSVWAAPTPELRRKWYREGRVDAVKAARRRLDGGLLLGLVLLLWAAYRAWG